MAKALYFKFVESGVSGRVGLLWDLAPVTCKTMWKAFKKPLRMTCFHAAFAGPEVMVGLDKAGQVFDPTKVPNENQTCFPGAGDVLWFYQGRNAMKGLSFELWEVGIFYDDGGRTFGPLGWTPVNIWAQMGKGLDKFADACRDIRLTGAKTLEIGRLKD
jgi:hypothetical protein